MYSQVYLWLSLELWTAIWPKEGGVPVLAGRMRLTSRQSISPWRVARRVFRHRREQQAARRKQPEASPRHWLRRGPAPVDEAPPAEDRA